MDGQVEFAFTTIGRRKSDVLFILAGTKYSAY